MAHANPVMNKVYAVVEAELGGGKVICTRCGCTLDTFADVCTSGLGDPCPGFVEVDRVRSAALHKELSA